MGIKKSRCTSTGTLHTTYISLYDQSLCFYNSTGKGSEKSLLTFESIFPSCLPGELNSTEPHHEKT